MKKIDLFFAIACGLLVAWIAVDFLAGKYGLFVFIFFPLFSVFCLWLAYFISKRFLFVLQAAKFILVGGFADIIDIKAFQLLFYLIPASLPIKAVSFLIAVVIKYIGNKQWVFNKTEKESIKELAQFLIVTLVGMGFNVSAFYCATEIIQPQFNMSAQIWTELSIIFAALVAAVWNFLGYKFLVFKK
jgi:putative flippase GtrA